jgi:carboxypeptidase family protein
MRPSVARSTRIGLTLPCLLFLSFARPAGADGTGTVSGKVFGENGIGIPSADVVILGARQGAITGPNGQFVILRVPEGSYTIRVQRFGYLSIERANLEVRANRTTTANFSIRERFPKMYADSLWSGPGDAVVLGARVIWVQGDRLFLASQDSLWLGPGAGLRFQNGGKEIATAEVTAVHNAVLIAARITSGSLRGVKRLDRIHVTSERDIVRPVSALRVGYPSRRRVHPLFECTQMQLDVLNYRADTLGERSFQLVRDSTWAPARPEPDTLHVRMFDDATDEEIALERGDLDVAIFWPGEASPHIREIMRWKGRPDALRRRGVVSSRTDGGILATRGVLDEDMAPLRSLNRELFRGDLRGPFGSGIGVADARLGPGLFEVDSTCPGHEDLERLLNRDIGATGGSSHRILLSCLDIPAEIEPGQDPSGWLFFIGCPVISRPTLRPYLEAIDLDSLVNLFDCRTAARRQ